MSTANPVYNDLLWDQNKSGQCSDVVVIQRVKNEYR